MGRKKKKFIDKKNAASFHVVQRTQNGAYGGDTGDADTEASKYVLQPTNYDAIIPADFPVDLLQLPPEAEPEHFFGGEEEEGVDIDGDGEYDYEQHMRTMGDGGTFFQDPKCPSMGDIRTDVVEAESKDEDDTAERLFEEMAKQESDTTFKLTNDYMDAFETGAADFGEIADDFVALAIVEDDAEEETKQAKEEAEDGEYEDEGDEGDEGDEDEDEDEEGGVPREKRLLDAHFDALLEQYDDFDDIGELDAEDPTVQGAGELEEYSQEIARFEERMQRNYGQAQAPPLTKEQRARVHKRLKEAEAEGGLFDVDEEGGAAIDAAIKAMFPVTERDNWDCESIVSTYTNTENHPNMISRPIRRNPKKTIKLSAKTGIPLGYLPNRVAPKAKETIEEGEEGEEGDEGEEEYYEPENLGEKRDRKESKEDKKARKEAVKAARREARDRKRNLKSKYSEEMTKQVKHDFHQKICNSAHVKL